MGIVEKQEHVPWARARAGWTAGVQVGGQNLHDRTMEGEGLVLVVEVSRCRWGWVQIACVKVKLTPIPDSVLVNTVLGVSGGDCLHAWHGSGSL